MSNSNNNSNMNSNMFGNTISFGTASLQQQQQYLPPQQMQQQQQYFPPQQMQQQQQYLPPRTRQEMNVAPMQQSFQTPQQMLHRFPPQGGLPPMVMPAQPMNAHQEAECPICLEVLKGSGKALFTTACGHEFHFDCITAAVTTPGANDACPLCRRNVPQLSPAPPVGFNYPPPPVSSYQPDETLDEDIPSMEDVIDKKESSSAVPSANELNLNITSRKEFAEVAAGEKKELYAMVTLRANKMEDSQKKRAPVDIVAVVDRSGSMSGQKIGLVQQSLSYLLTQIGSDDRMSVVSFDHRTYPIFGLTLGTPEKRAKMDNMVKTHKDMRASGGTNIQIGLGYGLKVLADRKHVSPVTAVMLLTDGQGGAPTQEWLTHHLGRFDNVPVHCFGFGRDHDARTMSKIAEWGNGMFAFIENVANVGDAFATVLGGMLSVAAQSVVVTINIESPNVRFGKLSSAYSHHFTEDRRSVRIQIPDIYSEEKKDLVFTLLFPGGVAPSASSILYSVSATYLDPNKSGSDVVKLPVVQEHIARPENPSETTPDLILDKERNRVAVALALKEATELGESHQLPAARERLSAAIKEIESSASASDPACKLLLSDLQDCRTRFATTQTYASAGYAFAKQQQNVLYAQRSAGSSNATSNAYSTPMQMQQQCMNKTYTKSGFS